MHKEVGYADSLPYETNQFDLVVSAWVLEHISNPDQVFAEVFRVLKPGGQFIFITPNVKNYYFTITRIIPQQLHDVLCKILYARQDKDTFNKYYRANTLDDLKRIAVKIGFNCDGIYLNSDPSYLSFNGFTFITATVIESVINRHFPNNRIHIIGNFLKPNSN